MNSTNEEKKPTVDFGKIRSGLKIIEDATANISSFKRINPTFSDKSFILKVIDRGDINTIRDISNFFANTSGIYRNLCNHAASFYKYDWILTPYINKKKKIEKDTAVELFNNNLRYLDRFNAKKFFTRVAYDVIKDGCYYGYIVQGQETATIQDLPVKYCRSRFKTRGRPVVEFQMRFFVDLYPDIELRKRILNMFPKDFRKGYMAYQDDKLPPQFQGDSPGWYTLDPNCAFKFSATANDFPLFLSVIPHILDLDEAQALDKKKMTQEILKIIIQKMPLDKNNELVFDIDEIQELHNNAVQMIGNAIGVNILSTPAEVEVADMGGNIAREGADQLSKVERSVFNEAGTAQNLFNPDGNLALEKSILNDEAALYNLILQFEEFLNVLIKPINKNKKISFQVQILPTTFYNYKEMAKLYKEQAQLGYSKVLPSIALGQSQSSIIATAEFEKDYLDLVNLFIPPISSNNMSAEVLKENGSNKAGRKEKPDDEKSDKTLQNRESMS